MRKPTIAFVLALSAATGFSQCRTDRASTRKEKSAVVLVILGTVTDAQPAPEAWDFLDGVNYTVHVSSKLHGKGPANEEVTVFSENSDRFFAMDLGQRYVLYLKRRYGRYQIDNCGNSHAIDQTSATKQPKLSAARGF